jgi:glutaminyl-peptide cyclotransferase
VIKQRKKFSLRLCALFNYLILLLFILPEPCFARASPVVPKVLTWTLVATYPHDPQAYTQGLIFLGDGVLGESTGLNGKSTIRRVDLKSGRVLSEAKLADEYFGEGLVRLGSEYIQLTWKNEKALIWGWNEKAGWKQKRSLAFKGEGWGLSATESGKIVMSDGTSKVTIRDPKDLTIERHITIKSGSLEYDSINELEVVGGHLYANRWQTSQILRIDLRTGDITGLIDLSKLIPKGLEKSQDAVANGIAWNPKDKVFYVTGKFWPNLYAIKISEK